MAPHVVTPGDCLNSIAKDQGFFNYQTVYKHGQNTTNFPNPNMLEEGKSVEIPDKTPKKIALTLDQEKKFLLDRQKTNFRATLVDFELKPLKLKSCDSTIGVKHKKKPAADGLLELTDIDPTEKGGSIVVEVDIPKPKPAKESKQAVDEEAYPLAIIVKDFKDKDPDPNDFSKVEWTLEIGHLEPHTLVRGVTQRLYNLGFNCPVVKVRG